MNYQNLCINCMREKETNQSICPYCGFDLRKHMVASQALPPFTRLNGRYLLGKVLGAGGFGITYIAKDLSLGRTVAVKEYYMQGTTYRVNTISRLITVEAQTDVQKGIYLANKEKFLKEAKTLAHLDNLPGIVRVHDFFNENNTSYMVLEYLEGMTLKRYVERSGGKLPIQLVLEKLDPVLQSLEMLHQRQILHRDISPDNIMVMKDGSLILFDFGGVKEMTGGQKSMYILAKSGFSPIEQLQSQGRQGPWTDVYAMAATIYYCICGVRPPDAINRSTGRDPIGNLGILGSSLTPAQQAVLAKGLAVNPRDRFQSMEVFRRSFRPVPDSYQYDQPRETGKPFQKPVNYAQQSKKQKWIWVAVLVMSVWMIVGGGIAFFLLRGSNEETEGTEQETEETSVVGETVDTQKQRETESPQITMLTVSPEETSVNDAAESTDYFFTDSDRRYLTESDIAGMSKSEINLAKNEIFAKLGRKFKRSDLQSYFDSQSWYHGTIDPDYFDANVKQLANNYEIENVKFLDKYDD